MTDGSDHRAHLEMIQAVIARQATNSFLAKGWAITLAIALYGFGANHEDVVVTLLGLPVVVVFWYLDAYFLRQERLFRCLYDAALTDGSLVTTFSMNTRPYAGAASASWWSVIRSKTLLPLYGALIVVGLLVVVRSAHENDQGNAERTASAMSSVNSSSHGVAGGQISPI
jgi:hypothetical protein